MLVEESYYISAFSSLKYIITGVFFFNLNTLKIFLFCIFLRFYRVPKRTIALSVFFIGSKWIKVMLNI